MQAERKSLVLLSVLAFTTAAWAQAPAPMPAKAQPVLDVVPAGTMGYIVVKNVRASLAATDKYLKDIGVDKLLPEPNECGLLGLIKLKLGDGFNPDGGFAVAMLDPQPLGIDLIGLMDSNGRSKQETLAQVPVVVFIPGTGVKEIFINHEHDIDANGPYCRLVISEDLSLYASQVGGYVVLSPSTKALDAALQAGKKASGELSPDQAELMANSEVSLNVNFKLAGPLYAAFLKKTKSMNTMSEPKRGPGPHGSLEFPPGSWLADMFSQMRTITLTVRLGVGNGLILDELVAMDPNSPLGKANAAVKPADGPLLARLPNLPYVLALDARGPANKVQIDMAVQMWDTMLKGIPQLSDDNRSAIKKIIQGYADQVIDRQFVAGGAPEGSGTIGLAAVVRCKDANAVKGLISDSAELAMSILQNPQIKAGPKLAGLKVAYAKDVDKIDSVSVDAVEVSHPDLAAMGDEEKARLTAVLGEDKVRLLVAACDKETLVITLGGSKAFLAETMKTAKSGAGTIGQDPEVVEVMKVLPKDPTMILLLNAGNLVDVVLKTVEAAGRPAPPLAINAKTPLAVAGSVTADGARVTFFVPNNLVKAAVSLMRMTMSSARQAVARHRAGTRSASTMPASAPS